MLGQHHMIMFTNFIFIFSFTIGCARTTKEIGLVKHTRQKKIFIQIGYSRTLRIHWYLLIFHRRYLIQQQISHYFGIPTFSPTLLGAVHKGRPESGGREGGWTFGRLRTWGGGGSWRSGRP